MRGSEQMKRTLRANGETLALLYRGLLMYLVCMVVLYSYRRTSLVLLGVLSVPDALVLLLVRRLARPATEEVDGVRRLVHVASLHAPGLASFLFDALFWCMLGKALVTFGWKWLLVYLGIPVSFFVEFLYKPYRRLRQGRSKAQ